MNSRAEESTGRKGKTKALVSLALSLMVVVGLTPSLSFATEEGRQTQGNENNTVTQQQTAAQEEGASLSSDEKEGTTDTGNYLTFTAEEAGSTVKFSWKTGSNVEVKASSGSVTIGDNAATGDWQTYTANTTITLTSVGDKVSFKGNSVTTEGSNNFSMTGKIAASGDVTSLTNGSGGNATLEVNYCYLNMFKDCTALTTAPNLPSTTLAGYCYYGMFQGCTKLTAAPNLPSTTLAEYCYYGMFQGCISLTAAPKLPATELKKGCYSTMFYGCTSLATAPNLPATTLAENCYQNMFNDCTSLTTAPDLPATVLKKMCYFRMFVDCKALEAPAMMSHVTTLATSCCQSMYGRSGTAESGYGPGCTSLKIYTSSQSGYAKEWKVGNKETVTQDNWATDMFTGCGEGASVDNVTPDTPYYIKSDLTVGDQTGAPTYGKAGTATYTLTKSARVSLSNYSVLWKNGDEFSATAPEGVTAAFSEDYATLTVSTEGPVSAGTYTFKVTAKNGDEDISSDEATLSINKASVSVPTAITGLVYNGSQQTGVALPKDAVYTLSGNTETNAGSHTATATLNNKDNYEWDLETPTSEDQSIQWSIAKAKVTLPTAETGLTYNGKQQTGVQKASDAVTLENNTATDAGSYSATAKLTSVTNYEWEGKSSSADQSIPWSIGARSVSLWSASATKVYDGTLLTAPAVYADENQTAVDSVFAGEVANLTASGSITNVSDSPQTNTISYDKGTSYKDANYSITKTEGKLTITKSSSLTISGTDYSGTYDGSAHGSAASPSVAEGTTVSYSTDGGSTWSETVPTITEVGTINVTAKAENANYKETTCTYTLTVTKAKVNLPIAKTSLIYNGSAQVGVELPDSAKYSLSDNAKTDAGEYSATAILTDKDNYEWNLKTPTIDDQTIPWSIAKRPITLTSASDSKVYDGTALTKDEVNVTSGSFANDEGATYDVTGSQTQVGIASNAFDIKEWTGGAKAENYDITRVFGTLEVTPAASSETEAMVDADSFKAAKESLEKKYSEMSEYAGKTITVDMTVNKAAASSGDVAKIQQKVGSKTLLSFDTALTVKADGKEIKTAGDDNADLITVTYAFDFSKKQDVQVMRLHKKYEPNANDTEYTVTESIDELTETANANGEYVTYDKDAGTVSVTACKYSTFSIAYNAVADSQGSGTAATKNTSAKTGDNTGLAVGALAAAALCAVGALVLARRRGSRR